MGLLSEVRRRHYEIPGIDGPVTVRCLADVDRILVELIAAATGLSGQKRTSIQFWEELDIVLDARLYFMKR